MLCAAGVLFADCANRIGVAPAGVSKEPGSRGFSTGLALDRRGLTGFSISSLAAGSCPLGIRHVELEMLVADVTPGACHPATGGVAASAAVAPTQPAASMKTMQELLIREEHGREIIGRSLGEAWGGNWLVERFGGRVRLANSLRTSGPPWINTCGGVSARAPHPLSEKFAKSLNSVASSACGESSRAVEE
jgi:hypothetical protein